MSSFLDRTELTLAKLARGAGPRVARLYHTLLAVCFAIAWGSLLVQVRVLIGERGLLPLNVFLDETGAQLSFWRFPTVFYFGATDALLVAGALLGIALAVLALLGVRPRLMFALSTALYLSYATACRLFLAFQWDNLLLECGLLASLLRTDRRSPAAVVMFEVLLFKLYFQSGIAKWQSHLGDWQDGSAMRFYYETAPLPAPLAWWMHQLPAGWHVFESWLVLALEIGLPFAIFFGRRWRLGAAVAFTLFQLANLATANYGFFAYLALALHVFLLDDEDLRRFDLALRRRLRRGAAQVMDWTEASLAMTEPPPVRLWVRGALAGAFVVYVAISAAESLWTFTPLQPPPMAAAVRELYEPLRLVNTYHLFGHITRERVEPEIQILGDAGWRTYDLAYKPGAADTLPGLVAPHQPRLDFQLWFHGLSYQRRPAYLEALVRRVCDEPSAVGDLFHEALPATPRAVRVDYWRYHFTTSEEHESSGAWWKREHIGTSPARACTR